MKHTEDVSNKKRRDGTEIPNRDMELLPAVFITMPCSLYCFGHIYFYMFIIFFN